jgi:hypothetical protein
MRFRNPSGSPGCPRSLALGDLGEAGGLGLYAPKTTPRVPPVPRRVASVSTPQKPHRGCPRSLALGDRGDSGPQLARRSPRSSRIGPVKRPCRQEGFPNRAGSPLRAARNPPRRFSAVAPASPPLAENCGVSAHHGCMRCLHWKAATCPSPACQASARSGPHPPPIPSRRYVSTAGHLVSLYV